MKVIVFFFMVLSTTAFADIQTSTQTFKSDISSEKAFNLPAGVVQIVQPSLPFNGLRDDDAWFNADSSTAQVICQSVGKSLIDYQYRTVSGSNFLSHSLASFKTNGAMSIYGVSHGYNASYNVITTVSCK